MKKKTIVDPCSFNSKGIGLMGKIIQVVEDDEDIRFILEYVLADSGFALETFDSVKAFSNRSRKNDVDLILLDVQLPDGNGIDLCYNLKTSELTRHIPVVVMSANASSSRALIDGKADDFIAKPFDLDELVTTIYNILS
jgi:two-component system phosphate regulon response regulator PhoB